MNEHEFSTIYWETIMDIINNNTENSDTEQNTKQTHENINMIVQKEINTTEKSVFEIVYKIIGGFPSTDMFSDENKNDIEKCLGIFRMTAKNHCGKCGCRNCFSFSIQVVSANKNINDCPDIQDEVMAINMVAK